VKYWGVGNESWGCGGRLSPEEYAEQYRRYATYLRTANGMLSEADMELVSVGHIDEGWNRTFLGALSECSDWIEGPYDLVGHMSVHRYYGAGGDTDFDEDQYYRLLARSRLVAQDIDNTVDALSTYARDSDISIIVDEWGVWHPEATADNVFIPFTIGGGIRSVEDAQAVLDAGADKISVNSAALARPELLNELADVFGARCVVIAIDAKRENGSYGVYVNGGRVANDRDANQVQVGQVMSQPVLSVPPECSLKECSRLLAKARLRRIPVFVEGEPVGIVSDTDVFASVEEASIGITGLNEDNLSFHSLAGTE
jgi:CBS domain-containing protein